jgi:hypothetical protein
VEAIEVVGSPGDRARERKEEKGKGGGGGGGIERVKGDLLTPLLVLLEGEEGHFLFFVAALLLRLDDGGGKLLFVCQDL